MIIFPQKLQDKKINDRVEDRLSDEQIFQLNNK